MVEKIVEKVVKEIVREEVIVEVPVPIRAAGTNTIRKHDFDPSRYKSTLPSGVIAAQMPLVLSGLVSSPAVVLYHTYIGT